MNHGRGDYHPFGDQNNLPFPGPPFPPPFNNGRNYEPYQSSPPQYAEHMPEYVNIELRYANPGNPTGLGQLGSRRIFIRPLPFAIPHGITVISTNMPCNLIQKAFQVALDATVRFHDFDTIMEYILLSGIQRWASQLAMFCVSAMQLRSAAAR